MVLETINYKKKIMHEATVLAKKTLEIGDVVVATGCGGIRRRIKFDGWDGQWICGKTVDNVSACSIYRVNGKPVDFTSGKKNQLYMKSVKEKL